MPGVDPAVVAAALYSESAATTSEGDPGTAGASPWEPPVPFDEFELPEFPTSALPDWLRDFVEAEARATQTLPDLSAMLALSVCAAACAGRIAIRLKDGHVEPVNLFTVTALPPGNRKSAVFRDVAAPLEEYEAAEAIRLGPAVAEARARRRIAEEGLKGAEARAARATPDVRDALIGDAVEQAREMAGIEVPLEPRLVVDDCSPERLATLMRDQGGRIAVLAPEGDVFELMAGRYSASGTPNLGIYLRGHAGDSVRVDRVGRPPEFVQAAALTIGLAVQPETLRGLMGRHDFRGRGLLARFLYSIPKSLLGHRDIDAPGVPPAVSAAYRQNILSLLALPAGTDQAGAPCPHMLTLDPAARAQFRNFEAVLEPELGVLGAYGHIADWAGKLAGAVGRLAAILHSLARAVTRDPWRDPVDAETVERAIQVGWYLVPHALAAYGAMGADADLENARQLLGWINRAGLESFTKRDAFGATRGRFKRVAAMEPALALLVEHGFIREGATESRGGPGRPRSAKYEVNPLGRPQNAQNPQNRNLAGDFEDSANSVTAGTQTPEGNPDGR